jgi:hypothetical protein
MNRTRISPLLAGVLVALAIPTGVVVALEAVMVDQPNQEEPPTTPQILAEEPLTGPVDPETEPLVPDSEDDTDRATKDRSESRDTKPEKKDSEERKGTPEKESPDDTLVSAPEIDPLVGAVKLESPVPLTKACAALAGGECPVDDVVGTVEELVAGCTEADADGECPVDVDVLTPPVTEVLRPNPVDIPGTVELPGPVEIPEAIENSDPEADELARGNAEAVRALLTALGLPVPEALGPPQK